MRIRRLPVLASLLLFAFTASPTIAQDLRDLAAAHIYQHYKFTQGEFGFTYEKIDDETLRILWLNVRNDLNPAKPDLGTHWTFLLFSTWREDGRVSIELDVDPVLQTVKLLPDDVLVFASYADKDMHAGIYGMVDLLTRTPERIGATTEMLIRAGGKSLESPLLEPFIDRLFQLAKMNDGIIDAASLLSLAALGLAKMTDLLPVYELSLEYLEGRPDDERVGKKVEEILAHQSRSETTMLDRVFGLVTMKQVWSRFRGKPRPTDEILGRRDGKTDPKSPKRLDFRAKIP